MRCAWWIALALPLLTACGEHWTFGVFGDASPATAEAEMPAVFARIIEEMNVNNVDLALFTGDLVRGRTVRRAVTAAQYERAWFSLRLLRPRLWIVPGNHDVDGAGGLEEFVRRFGPVPWTTTHRSWMFIGLTTEKPGARGLIEGEQMRWLKDRLAERPSKSKTVVIMHRPVWPTPLAEGRYHSLPQPDLHRLFVQEGVTAVFSGHEHHDHVETRDGILYVISGGAGSDLLSGASHHYILVQVRGGSLTPQVDRLR